MPKPKEPTDKNSILMRECGAKSPYPWEPEPRDQILYALNRGDWMSRIIGWMKWHTTRGSRSAWAMSDKGKPLTIKHAADDLGWPYKTALNRFAIAEEEGVIRRHPKMPWIGLCADIPLSRQTRGENDSRVQNQLPPQLIEQIEGLSEPDRELFRKAYARFRQWSKEAFDDVATQIRRQQALAEDTILSQFGLERERKAKEFKPKTAAKVDLPALPNFVQLVQDEICTTPETAVVQPEIEAHIKEADTDLKLASAPPELRAHLTAVARDNRRALGEPSEQTCRNFWKEAIACGETNVEKIAMAATWIVRENEGIKTWGGVLTVLRQQIKASKENQAA